MGAIFSFGVVSASSGIVAGLSVLELLSSDGSVTPGMDGRLHGGLIECGELRQCNRNFLSYTIRVPRESVNEYNYELVEATRITTANIESFTSHDST